jgi:DNA sulfur modification protein DndC
MSYSHYPVNEQSILHIQQEYSRASTPWFLGYSGGKDSSALLKLVFIALLHVKPRRKPVTVVYCDTGVDIPVIRNLAVGTLHDISIEAEEYGIPIRVKCVSPELKNRYFVKVIGRGYPPPSNKFRWCTDRLRIGPVNQVLNTVPGNRNTVLLGIRRGESVERDRTISKHDTGTGHYFRHSSNNSLIYSPIVDYSVEEIWNTLTFNVVPNSIDVGKLWTLYQDSSGECPIIRDPKGSPCGKGRFGCWTCTVVRKDRAVRNLVREGYTELAPLFHFRNWLAQVRDDPEYRCKKRRNGMPGPGPFTLAARQEILDKLLEAQTLSGLPLATEEELEYITQLWDLDRNSPAYLEN